MKKLATTLIALSIGTALSVQANEATVNVNAANFVRAESDTMLQRSFATMNMITPGTQIGQLAHIPEPFPLDRQPVIRMNRDTLYSSALIDLSKPVTITLPEIGGRYQSIHIVSQDHYMFAHSEPGTYTITQEMVGTRYAAITVRTFVDADSPEDIKLANVAQSKIKFDAGVVGGDIDVPNWNQEQLTEIRQHLSRISVFGVDPAKGFGTKEEVDQIQYLVNAAAGWGGLPKAEAMYEISEVENNDGTPYSVTFKDVPVDAFWSVTVYNKEGYIELNDMERYSFNNVTAKTNSDGSQTINFGACEDGRVNCLPVSEGWGYAFRFYKPQEALMSGEWTSPKVTPVK